MYFSKRFQSELRLMTSVYQQMRTNLKKFCENKSFCARSTTRRRRKSFNVDVERQVSIKIVEELRKQKISGACEAKWFRKFARDFWRNPDSNKVFWIGCAPISFVKNFEKIWKDFECTAGSWPKTFELKTFKGQWGRTISKSFERILPGGSSEFFLAKCSELGVPLSALKKNLNFEKWKVF